MNVVHLVQKLLSRHTDKLIYPTSLFILLDINIQLATGSENGYLFKDRALVVIALPESVHGQRPVQ